MNPTVKNVISIVVIVTLVYFGNNFLQSYLGEKAIGKISFEVYDLAEAKALAEQQGKLVLADYSAIWCPSCRKLDNEVFANSDIATTIESSFIYARLEHDTIQGTAFARQYDLVGFPRVLVLDPNGEQLVEMPLTFNPHQYQANLDRVVSTFIKSE